MGVYKSNKMEDSLPYDVIRKLHIKQDSETNPAYGKKPEERSIEELLQGCIINLDKPAGPTSHEVTAWVKKILKARKAGHGGTLDPKVTGILPTAINNATKVVQALLPAGKEYVTIMRLHGDVSTEKLESVIEEFRGEINQKVPLRAAVKRRIRKRKIYYLTLLEISGRFVLLKVGCEGGTYIRMLCHDIGKLLGCGAHMAELRRTRTGPFREDNTLITLHDLLDAYILWKKEGEEKYLRHCLQPVEAAVQHFPKIYVIDSAVSAICHGASLAIPGIASVESGIRQGTIVALFTLKNELIALAKATKTTEQILIGKKGVAARVERVFMDRNLYPRMWKERT